MLSSRGEWPNSCRPATVAVCSSENGAVSSRLAPTYRRTSGRRVAPPTDVAPRVALCLAKSSTRYRLEGRSERVAAAGAGQYWRASSAMPAKPSTQSRIGVALAIALAVGVFVYALQSRHPQILAYDWTYHWRA